MTVEIIIAEQERYYYRYILIRGDTWWLYVHMVTLKPSALMFSIYIDVNGCTNGHMPQYIWLNNQTLWHWDHHFIILSCLDGSSVHTWYIIMQTETWCLGGDACSGDKYTVGCMITLN